MELNSYFKSIIDSDFCSVVICDLDHTIIYMNPSSVRRYKRNLVGNSIMDCHNSHSNKIIYDVVEWFKKDKCNNRIYTFYNEKENKDVYMVALRDDNEELIGYYEKHEYRNRETSKLYDFK